MSKSKPVTYDQLEIENGLCFKLDESEIDEINNKLIEELNHRKRQYEQAGKSFGLFCALIPIPRLWYYKDFARAVIQTYNPYGWYVEMGETEDGKKMLKMRPIEFVCAQHERCIKC